MRTSEVIPAKRWKHKRTGGTASIHGAVPWTGEPGNQAHDWILEVVGWTVCNPDGTVGIGRAPFKTKKEAQAFLERGRRAGRCFRGRVGERT